jgi:uncharacterized protein
MNILILSDGKAGHVSQAKAVAMALGKFLPVTTRVLGCRLRAGFLQRPLRLLLNAAAGKLPALVYPWMHAGGRWPEERPDLIVSAGGSTCAANAWLAAKLGVPNIFCGSIRSLRPDLFAGIVTAFDPPEAHARYIRCVTAVAIDPAGVAEQGAAWRRRTNCQDRCWSLLAGGPGAGYVYRKEDWQRVGTALARISAQHGVRWLVSTSRRTGADGEAALFDGLDPGLVAGSTRAAEGKSDISYHEILGAAERHFVTEDSHMMITESIASGRPVHTLQPEEFQTDEGNLHFLRIYGENGWIVRQRISALSEPGLTELPPAPKCPPTILDDLAKEIAAWLERLPAQQAAGLRTK